MKDSRKRVWRLAEMRDRVFSATNFHEIPRDAAHPRNGFPSGGNVLALPVSNINNRVGIIFLLRMPSKDKLVMTMIFYKWQTFYTMTTS
jgi:hypothetical protein